MSKKKVIINVSILLIVMGFTMFYLFKDNGLEKIKSLSNLSWYHLLLLVITMVLIFLIEGIIIKIASLGIKDKFSFANSIGAFAIGNLGSNISPFKSMHYPAIFYYFNKKNHTFEESLANTTKCSIVYGFSTSILYIVLFIVAHVNKFTIDVNGTTIYIEIATLIGLAVNVFQIAFYLTLAYNEKVHNWFIKVISAILFKFKKIKDKEQYKNEQKLKMKVFKEQIKYFIKHLTHFAIMTVLYIIRVMVFGSLTYVIYLMLSSGRFDLKTAVMFFVLYQASAYITNIVPTPGGSGGFEFSFMLVYAGVIADTYISSTLLAYRSITYFIPMIVESIYFAFVVFKNKKEEPKIENETATETIIQE